MDVILKINDFCGTLDYLVTIFWNSYFFLCGFFFRNLWSITGRVTPAPFGQLASREMWQLAGANVTVWAFLATSPIGNRT